MVTVTEKGYTVHRHNQGPVNRPISRVDWDLDEVERGGYPHFMLKEIMEQPETLRATMRGRLLEEEGNVKLGGLTGMDEELLETERVIILGCGTSWHSGLIGEYLIEEFARVPSRSGVRERVPLPQPAHGAGTRSLLAITQSGETADTLCGPPRVPKRMGPRRSRSCNVGRQFDHRARGRRRRVPARRAGDRRRLARRRSRRRSCTLTMLDACTSGRLRGTLTSHPAGSEIMRRRCTQLPDVRWRKTASEGRRDHVKLRRREVQGQRSNVLYLGRGSTTVPRQRWRAR
jgi:glucosamine--fructose-6-phosphate aminotransferase (isomerizing)